jgi:amidase
MFARYPQLDGLALAHAIRAGEIGADEVLEAALARMEAIDPRLNAVVLPMPDQARERLRRGLPQGPFTGVPVLLKDLVSDHAGVPSRLGNKRLKFDARPAARDSELIARLIATGVSIIGKTNTPELGLTPYTEPEAFGATRNPWREGYSAGGSSGGSAAAVAAGIVPIATGGDGAGSIRIPASCCGIFGLKPSRGRMPSGPGRGDIWGGLTVEHVLTRSVRDSAAMLDSLSGADLGAPYAAPAAPGSFLLALDEPPPRLRVAFTSRPLLGHGVHPDCVAGVTATANLLGDLGHAVDEDSPQVDAARIRLAFVVVIAANVRAEIESIAALLGKPVSRVDFEPATWCLGLLGQAFRASELVAATTYLHQVSRDVAAFFERYDVLLTPTLAAPPHPIGALQPTAFEQRQLRLLGALGSPSLLRRSRMHELLAERLFDFTPYTPLFNVTGQPAMSVPLSTSSDGLPVGMQFVGRFGDEATLLQLARQLEIAQPWVHRLPVC